MGPTPKPSVTDLRSWDMKLLNRYEPFYAPFCDMCCLCTYGKCDLLGKQGACGIDAKAQQGRMVLIASCIGTAAHGGHARHLLEYLIEKKGEDFPVDLGGSIDVEAPIMRTVIGKKPETLADLREAIEYVEEQTLQLLSATHTGQEGNYLDFESKVLHAGLMDHVGMEVGDIAQIVALNLPKGSEDTELVELGLGTIDQEKPVILCIGHNVAPGAGIIDYMEDQGLEDDLEVCGICCAAIDITRYNNQAKVVGPISKQLKFVRSGVADVVVVDEQCVRTDVLQEARKNKAVVIATTDKICIGLPDKTKEDPDKIVSELLNDEIEGALILDPAKVGEVAVKSARKLSGERENLKMLPDMEEVVEYAKECTECGWCDRVCPNSLPMMDAVMAITEGDFSKMEKLKIDQKPFRFLVSRLSPAGGYLFGTNMEVSLEEYSIVEDANQGQDITVAMELKQYKHYATQKLQPISNQGDTILAKAVTERSAKEPAKSYTVKEGDTLWAICKRELGDGSKYAAVAAANGVKNPNLIYPGQTISLEVISTV